MKNYEIIALQTRLADMAGQLQLVEKIFDHGDLFFEETAAQALSEHLTELAQEAQTLANELEPLKRLPVIVSRTVEQDGKLVSSVIPGNGHRKEAARYGSTAPARPGN